MKIVILIPTYNERQNIKKLIARLQKVTRKMKGYDFQILVVDDNSPDGTSDEVSNLSSKVKNLTLLLRKNKEGLGAAYFAGMKHAFGKVGADFVITMDADLSHDPKYIPQFLQKAEQGASFVVGSRYMKGGSIAQGWALRRKFLSIFGNLVTRLLLWSNVFQDWTSGYRLIKRNVFARVAPRISDFQGYTFNISFAYFALQANATHAEVPIKFVDRTEGDSKLGFEYMYRTPIFLLKTRLGRILHVVLDK